MENEFNSHDFEHFLKQKTDQYKIYPSEKIWKGVYSALHTNSNWFKIGGALFILTAIFFIGDNIFFDNSSRPLKGRVFKGVTKKVAFNSAVTHLITPKVKSDKKVTALSQVRSVGQKNAATFEHKPAKNITLAPALINGSILPVGLVNTEDALAQSNITIANISERTGPTDAGNIYAIGKTDDILQADNKLLEDPLQAKKTDDTKTISPVRLTSPGKNRFNLQFYFSPTISYRRLADNKNAIHSGQRNMPLASNYLNIDRFVDHNPSIGAELGSNILLKAGRNFTIKSGLQFNYSHYTIKAYKFYYEKASIALNPVGRIADTLTAYTSFRNFSGYYPENLQNQYFQISAPIGVDVKLLGNKRLQLNVAGTIQPTYLLFSDTYLLSTDYVNYAKEPSLVRKWNVHTSFETFISYKVGGVRWQVGPQFRYQLLSTYNDRYPIKEYLMEYGFKVGITKTLR